MTAEALFARWRDRIESELDAALPSPAEAPQGLHQAMRYSVLVGGKRMRPAMVLMVARALGYEGTHHQLLAAVVEFIHTATLLHDDVVDESDLRRGRDTANAVFGNAASVLVGDYLPPR
ncbi:hypothetical protein G6F59_016918 [Rhizopus arrhizus]|nr:hypothetical protein G6F59_016918 [Rhizopus arrhizus]